MFSRVRRRFPGSWTGRRKAHRHPRLEGLEARSLLSSTALHAAFTGAWSAPAPLAYGTALGPAQLDATADVPGTFAYSPGAGTILDAGVHILSVTFTPSDSVDYTSVTATTMITVTKATPTVRVTADGGVYDGSPFDAAALVSLPRAPHDCHDRDCRRSRRPHRHP